MPKVNQIVLVHKEAIAEIAADCISCESCSSWAKVVDELLLIKLAADDATCSQSHKCFVIIYCNTSVVI